VKKKKPAKGETRKAIENVKAVLRQEKEGYLNRVANDSDDSEA
jgi:hypothetical protein